MPRPPRADVAGGIYHVFNRGDCCGTIFQKDKFYEAFEKILDEGSQKFPVALIAHLLMPNHWHLGVSPRENGALSKLMS